MLHYVLKLAKIQAARRVFARDGVAHEAVFFAVVERKVLYARADSLRLHALDHRRAEHSRKIRILGKILEIPPAERASLYVHARSEQNVNAVATAFVADRRAHFPEIFGIPARCRRRRRRKGRRGQAFGYAIVAALDLHAQSVRPVGHSDGRHAEARNRICVHEIRPRDERRFFVYRHFG